MEKESFNNGENQLTISSGKDDNYSHEVAVILDRESSRAPIDYSPVRDNENVRLYAMHYSISIVQCNAPIISANSEEMESFYDSPHESVNAIPSLDVKFIIGDLNAKIGQILTPNTICGEFVLGEQNK